MGKGGRGLGNFWGGSPLDARLHDRAAPAEQRSAYGPGQRARTTSEDLSFENIAYGEKTPQTQVNHAQCLGEVAGSGYLMAIDIGLELAKEDLKPEVIIMDAQIGYIMRTIGAAIIDPDSIQPLHDPALQRPPDFEIRGETTPGSTLSPHPELQHQPQGEQL